MAAKRRVGRLLVIGGAEDPDENDMEILPHLVKTSGGKRSRVLICSAPSEDPEQKVRVYRALFERIGVADVYEAPIGSRAEAETEEMAAVAEKATAVFLTGGDQLRLTALVAGTRLLDVVRRRLFEEGLVVAGTSAGAAAMGGTMIIGGAAKGTVRRADVDLAPGLGLWRDTVVDTHFNQRGRVSRLLTVFAHNPQVLCVGIDENTALDLTPGEGFRVMGAGAVIVLNGRVSHTNAPEAGADQVLALTDSATHVLAEGYGFDLRTKRPLMPDGGEIPAPTWR